MAIMNLKSIIMLQTYKNSAGFHQPPTSSDILLQDHIEKF